MLLAFLLGAVPFWIMARATRWRLKRRLESAERALSAAVAAAAPPSTASAVVPIETPASPPSPPLADPA
jgi:hypothetical protein